MVSRDRRDPIVLQKLRKQGIKSGISEHQRFWQEIIYKSLIPTFGLLVITVCLPKVGIKLL